MGGGVLLAEPGFFFNRGAKASGGGGLFPSHGREIFAISCFEMAFD